MSLYFHGFRTTLYRLLIARVFLCILFARVIGKKAEC